MTVLPIVGRELRVASRRRGTWLTRIIAAFLTVAVGAFVLFLAESGERPGDIAARMFKTVAGFLFVYTTIAGPLVTCDCLSEEKREGTLGLLFLTDLKGYDIVFGKLAATSMNTIYGMFAVVPLVAIPILMGGVSSAEFWRVVIVAVSLLMLSLSAGILASSLSRSDHRAMLLSFVILGALIFGPAFCSLPDSNNPAAPAILVFSPVFGCFGAFDDLYRHPGVKDIFWSSVGMTQVYVWTFLLIALRIVPKSWQETGERFERRGFFATVREVLNGDAQKSASRRRKMLEANPFFWRVARGRAKQFLTWLFVVTAAIVWLSTMPKSYTNFYDPVRDVVIIVLVHAAFKWWMAAESCRHLSDDRRSGGLELLLSTPLNEREIVRGQRRALLNQFGGPVAAVLFGDFLCLLMALKHGSADERNGWLLLYVILGGSLVFDLIALSTVGMWLGLSGRKTNRATISALLRILVLPSVLFGVALALWAMIAPNPNDITSTKLAVLWVALCAVTNAVFMASAHGHLQQFRAVVAERFTTTPVAEPKPKRLQSAP
jgi:ABC-type transport system involved in multi-copper enzyme maturation permease subunit